MKIRRMFFPCLSSAPLSVGAGLSLLLEQLRDHGDAQHKGYENPRAAFLTRARVKLMATANRVRMRIHIQL